MLLQVKTRNSVSQQYRDTFVLLFWKALLPAVPCYHLLTQRDGKAKRGLELTV